jgi:hypothetical protein
VAEDCTTPDVTATTSKKKDTKGEAFRRLTIERRLRVFKVSLLSKVAVSPSYTGGGRRKGEARS